MEIIDATLLASGWPDAATVLRERWIDAALPFDDAHFHAVFRKRTNVFISRPTGRALGSDWARMPTLPDHMPASTKPRRIVRSAW